MTLSGTFNNPERREAYRRALPTRDRSKLDGLGRRTETLMNFAIGTHNRLRPKKITDEIKRLQSRQRPRPSPQGGPAREPKTAQALYGEAARNVDHRHDMRLKRIDEARQRTEDRLLSKGRGLVAEKRFSRMKSGLGRSTSFSKAIER